MLGYKMFWWGLDIKLFLLQNPHAYYGHRGKIRRLQKEMENLVRRDLWGKGPKIVHLRGDTGEDDKADKVKALWVEKGLPMAILRESDFRRIEQKIADEHREEFEALEAKPEKKPATPKEAQKKNGKK
jgi:hypothetical protein